MITRCDNCLGKKVVMGLGQLLKDCPSCKGVGHIKTLSVDVEVDKMMDGLKSKRGRPKRMNDERKEA